MTQGSGSASFNFGGGTLGATAPWSSAMSLNLTGSGGNATIDTTGGNISLAGNLTGSGTLNKVGPGMLSLSGTSSVLGGSSVNGGTLQIPSGSLTAATEYVGTNGNGTVTQTGGTNTITNALYLGLNPGSIGTYNLSGGLLVVTSILVGLGLGLVEYHRRDPDRRGRRRSQRAHRLDFIGQRGTFNTAISSLTVAGQISGSGGMTKTGPHAGALKH